MGRFSTEGIRKKAREQAEREYAAGWNLRPAKGVPPDLVDSLVQEARALKSVRWLTMGESRSDQGGPVALLVGVRLDPTGPLTFAQARARLEDAARDVPQGQPLKFEELDADVAARTPDGGRNPYLIFARDG